MPSSPASPISSSFPQLPTRITRSSEEFSANASAWDEVLGTYSQNLEQVSSEGTDGAVQKHTGRGQLLGMCMQILFLRLFGSIALRAPRIPSHLVVILTLHDVLARRRVSLLLDENSPFLELGAFTGFGNEDSTIAASLVTGIGLVKYI